MWSLDDIRNERWLAVQEFLDQLPLHGLSELDKSVLLAELCFHGKSHLVRQLLELGADPNFCFDGTNVSPFSYDLEPGTTPIGQTILGSKWRGHRTFRTLHVLLMGNGDPNAITFSGYTPLQLAIVFDRPEFAGLLLLYGADPHKSSADLDKPTAFDFAHEFEWARPMLDRCRPEGE